jgi:hypothetical protein
MVLLRKLFWIAFFLVATFGFVVLFEHGTENYLENAKTEFELLKQSYNKPVERPKDESDAAAH